MQRILTIVLALALCGCEALESVNVIVGAKNDLPFAIKPVINNQIINVIIPAHSVARFTATIQVTSPDQYNTEPVQYKTSSVPVDYVVAANNQAGTAHQKCTAGQRGVLNIVFGMYSGSDVPFISCEFDTSGDKLVPDSLKHKASLP